MPQSKNCQGLSQSNGFQGVSQSKGLKQNDCQGVPKSKEMSGGYQNQNDCEGLPQLKGIPGSITIKMTAREYNKIVFSEIIQ